MILERLDRTVINYEWLNIYPEAHIHHLPRSYSNHCLLLLTLNKNTYPKTNIFIFETMWLSHQEFPQLVDQIWQTSPPLVQVINTFIILVKMWNKESFKYIYGKLDSR